MIWNALQYVVAVVRLAVTGISLKEKGMRRSTWICLDDCQAPFVAHLQSPWGASGKPRSWRRFPDKRYRGPTGATRSTVYFPSPSSRSVGVPLPRPHFPHDVTPPMQRQRQRQGQGSDDGDDARRNERWRRGRHQRRTRPPYWITLVNFCAEAVWIFSPCAEGSSSRLCLGFTIVTIVYAVTVGTRHPSELYVLFSCCYTN